MEDEIANLKAEVARLKGEREWLPVPVVELDADNRFTGWNHAAESLFGWTREEVLGRYPIPWFVPAGLEPLMLEVVEKMKRGVTSELCAVPSPTKAGGVVTCDWYHTPRFDENGVYAGRTAIGSDVTARVKAEDALRETITRSPLAAVAVDAGLRITWWNPAAERLFGWKRDEVLGRTITGLILPDEMPGELHPLVDRIKVGDMDVCGVNENLTKDGRVLVCEWFNTPHLDETGAFAGNTGLAVDRTERVRAQEALRDSVTRLPLALVRTDPEFRVTEWNPAAEALFGWTRDEAMGMSVTGLILPDEMPAKLVPVNQRLRSGDMDSHSVNENINLQAVRVGRAGAIDDCIDAIDGTIVQVRRLSLDLRPGMLDSLGLSATLRWLVSHVAVPAGLTVHTDIIPSGEPPPGELATACFRVAQEALTNVVRHAKATSVWVTMEQEDGTSVSVSVRDDGIGFDRETELARAGRGESLGLLGIRERVELFEGRLEIDSAPGKGTQIRVWFPVRQSI